MMLSTNIAKILVLATALLAHGTAASTCEDDAMDLCDLPPLMIGTCAAEGLDLCDDVPVGSCAEEGLDLCDGITEAPTEAPTSAPVTAPPVTAPPVTGTCAEEDLDLCDDIPKGMIGTCAQDETDLCIDSPTDPPPTRGTFIGTLTFTAAGLTSDEVETASKKTIAKKLNVGEDTVTVTAKESRRLAESMRRLSGDWRVDFEVSYPQDKYTELAGALNTIVGDTSSLQAEMAVQLQAAGATKEAAESLKVTGFQAKSAAGTTPSPDDFETSKSHRTSGALAVGVVVLTSTLMSSPSKPLGVLSSLFGFSSTS